MRTDPSKIIPTSADTSEQWVNWHKTLKKWFSKTEANSHWLRFWNQRAGAGSEADTHELRTYMEGQGVELTTTASGEVADTFLGAVDWFENSLKWAKGIVIGGVIIGIGLIAFYIVNSTLKGKTASEMTSGMNPLGRRKQIQLLKLL